jgi:acyl carrier protein phosphodiesterase
MNYLAHAWLSFNDPEILVGNMISDYVKGKKKFDYPPGIQQGIHLHRLIDTFTDEHPITKRAKEVFRPHYRLYSGAFVDVAYDHFLALDKDEFPENALFSFSQQVYAVLERHNIWMPPAFSLMFPHMKQHNWLYNYHTRLGTKKSFGGVVRRSAYLTEADTAADLFDRDYQLLADCYRHFWAELKPFAFSQFQLLKEKGQI